MRVIERSFSELLRDPKSVTSDVEAGDVLLRRRDEPDLRLSKADREEARSATFAAVGRALRNLAVNSPAALGTALVDAFSWLEFLPSKEQHLFVDEFCRVMIASSELDSYAALTQLVQEWRATAEVYADPELARRLKRPLQAKGDRIARPSGH